MSFVPTSHRLGTSSGVPASLQRLCACLLVHGGGDVGALSWILELQPPLRAVLAALPRAPAGPRRRSLLGCNHLQSAPGPSASSRNRIITCARCLTAADVANCIHPEASVLKMLRDGSQTPSKAELLLGAPLMRQACMIRGKAERTKAGLEDADLGLKALPIQLGCAGGLIDRDSCRQHTSL